MSDRGEAIFFASMCILLQIVIVAIATFIVVTEASDVDGLEVFKGLIFSVAIISHPFLLYSFFLKDTPDQ